MSLLDAVSLRLDFACEVDWNETAKFLKVEFPTTIRSDTATYEIQFGHVSRPTRFNNSFDIARFEVCTRIAGRTSAKRASASRCSTIANMATPLMAGPCAFRCSAHPSIPIRWPTSAGITSAMRSCPTPAISGLRVSSRRHRPSTRPWSCGRPRAAAGEHSFLSSSAPALVIDTVKKAEDSDALIVRLYEAHGSHGKATLRLDRKFKSARLCNLLEDEGKPLVLRGHLLPISYRPHEIITIKLR